MGVRTPSLLRRVGVITDLPGDLGGAIAPKTDIPKQIMLAHGFKREWKSVSKRNVSSIHYLQHFSPAWPPRGRRLGLPEQLRAILSVLWVSGFCEAAFEMNGELEEKNVVLTRLGQFSISWVRLRGRCGNKCSNNTAGTPNYSSILEGWSSDPASMKIFLVFVYCVLFLCGLRCSFPNAHSEWCTSFPRN
jgi:hypothetical protein